MSKIKYSNGSNFIDITARDIDGLPFYPAKGNSADAVKDIMGVCTTNGSLDSNAGINQWGAVITFTNEVMGTPFQIAISDGNGLPLYKRSISTSAGANNNWLAISSAIQSGSQPDNSMVNVWIQP